MAHKRAVTTTTDVLMIYSKGEGSIFEDGYGEIGRLKMPNFHDFSSDWQGSPLVKNDVDSTRNAEIPHTSRDCLLKIGLPNDIFDRFKLLDRSSGLFHSIRYKGQNLYMIYKDQFESCICLTNIDGKEVGLFLPEPNAEYVTINSSLELFYQSLLLLQSKKIEIKSEVQNSDPHVIESIIDNLLDQMMKLDPLLDEECFWYSYINRMLG